MTITVKHTKVSTVPDSADTSLVRPSDWNADHTLIGLGTMAEQDANNVSITGGSISGATVSGYIPTSEKGAANGVATLDAGGKVPASQIPMQGDLNYQGTWNASTNTPTLTSSTGTKGYYYVVDLAGTTNLDGITDWQIGDWAIYNGTVWQKVDNTDLVTSVNGQVGTVVLTTTDIAEGTNEYFTQARARASISAGTGISYDSGTGVVTNAAPDQTVTITGAGTTVVSGTYPNFTVTSNDEFDGDVVGPASATDNALARFDTTTGKLIQNSQVLLDDNGNATGLNSVTFDTTPTTPPTAEGALYWDNSDSIQTLNLVMAGGNATQHIGEETYYRVKASSAITNGQVVMFTGTLGSSGGLTAAPATGLTAATASYVMGIATQDIPLNGWGYITHFGEVKQIDTSAFSAGDILYYDPTVPGGLTATLPSAPNAKIQVCAVINSSSTVGILFVRPAFGGYLGQYEGDVQITSPASGQLLVRDQTAGKWVNAALTDGTGISITEGAGSVTVTNTAPDQVVNLTGTGGAVISGTYPNFTITTPSGTVTDVTGTAPIASTGGATPAISISQATTSTDGYLSSTDWNTFNGKANSFTYTSTYIPYGQGTTTPNQSASLTFDGTALNAPIHAATNGIMVNSATISASYSIPSGSNALSAGPITINSGVTVTIPTGSVWVVA